MKVRNMESSRGNKVANQFVIEGAVFSVPTTSPDGKNTMTQPHTGTAFQSYQSIIAFKTGRYTYLDSHYWDYSRTTSRYLGLFLGEPMSEVRKKVKSGEYKLVDLNG